ncbi:hypothetical protein LUZ61_013361 [Rhynchospora tenuis]|uniref:AAA+ ATPase domain-containing protein n=1 Tax=Rhynchospora tenuis TaxID=198213 RepID=A0AAD5W8V4_9POAL|nr:hypothetical protein LUZ61_013361 [Rhynchospora tenuis]
MEFLKLAVSFVVPFILYMVMKHVVYLFTARGTIRALELATVELQSLKKVVETEINKAKPENRAPTNEAQEWVSQVETLVKEAEEIQQNYRQLCWCSWSISPNFHTIHNISRSAAVKHVEVKSLCDKKANIEVLTVHPPPLLTHEMPASSSTIEAEETMNILPPPAHKTQAYTSKLSKLESALHFVKDDVHGIIGIWGMGGVGKTHLLKQINNELSRDPEFNVVVFITCSKHCSEEKVQNEIIDNLRLDKSGSTKQKQSTIHNFLKERSFVLLLDDLWNHVDLDTIGIPNPLTAVEACKRKIVLTTRSTEVCEQMEVNKRLRVDVLNWDDAWALFQEQVSKEIIDCDPMVQKFAVIIVKELGGLPLALITVGRAMYDKADCNEWEKAVELLKEARLDDVEFSQANQSVFHTLRFSYDSLKNDTLKQCFLHCALWPEDHPIQKNDLIELWMGLGLIDEPNIQAAYNVGYNYIRTLQAICLLEIHDDYTIDGDGTLKMHDVIRDMALWIANSQGADLKSWNVQAGTYKKAQKVRNLST